jgi:hypothetical protein
MKRAKATDGMLPSLTKSDEKFLHELCVSWNPDLIPGFIVPRTLRGYLKKYPNDIRSYTEVAAKQLGYTPFAESFYDDWSQDLILMFLNFAKDDLEDIVEMYITAPERTPGQPVSDHFNAYIQFRVTAALPTSLYGINPAGE